MMHASETVMLKLLGGQQHFMVPLFQRTYTWKQEDWETLWLDVAETYGLGPGGRHFLGSIVTKSQPATPEGVSPFLVIDGQQRLTTLTILLAALRDTAKDSSAQLAKKIHDLYLTNQYASGNSQYKVLPTQGDRPAYFAVVESKAPDTPTAPPPPIQSAYSFFRARLTEPDEEGAPLDLERLTQTIVGGLEIVSITLGQADNEYRIFESLNGTGQPLTQADLLRNFFFMRIPASQQDAVYSDLWLPLQRNLGSHLEDFFRYEFMSDAGQFVREGDIYQEWKKRLDALSPDDLIARLRLLARDGGFYHRLVVPAQEPDAALAQQLARLNRWGGQTFYPFLLYIYRRYHSGEVSAQQFTAIVQILESFLVRRFFARIPTNQLNRLFIRLAQQLPADLDLAVATRAALSKQGLRWPNDAEFRAAILRFPLYTEGRAEQRRLIIETLEASHGHKEAVDLAGMTIEHVMPQTLTPEWQASLGDDAQSVHDELLHILGNLTLTGYNSELSNRPFAEKRVALAQSNIQLNKEIAQETEWTRAQIEARAERLADRALTLWLGPLAVSSTSNQAKAQQTKASNGGSKKPWDEESLFAALERLCTPAGVQAARRMYDYATERGAKLDFNSGNMPAVSAHFLLNDRFTSVFGISEWPAGKGVLTVNFEYLLGGGIPIDDLSRLAGRLREIPGVEERCKGLEEQGYKRRPSLGIEQILTQSGAVEKIQQAIDELVQA